MQIVLQFIFWTCLAMVAYAYALYPLAIYACSRYFGRQPAPPRMAYAELPTLSVLIAAHNEAAVIEQRIGNALDLDYPPEKLEIVIASDGSDDDTVELVNRYRGQVRLLNFTARQGKAATINAAIPHLAGEIVLLSDANTSIEPSAARNLVRWFSDPRVGAVCGRLILVDPAGGHNVDGLYWRYETFLKTCEGRLGALLGSNGAIYAIRRDEFNPIPSQTIVDDFVIPLLGKMHGGLAIIYDRDAVGWEETPAHMRDEFHRRVRIGAGGFQAIGMLWPLLDPRRGWIAFTFLSHKILRWCCPFFLLGAIADGAMLYRIHPVYRWWMIAQMCFYAFSAAVPCLPRQMRWLRPLLLAAMFTGMNAALLMGFARWIRGRQQGAWQRTPRSEAAR